MERLLKDTAAMEALLMDSDQYATHVVMYDRVQKALQQILDESREGSGRALYIHPKQVPESFPCTMQIMTADLSINCTFIITLGESDASVVGQDLPVVLCGADIRVSEIKTAVRELLR